MLTLGFYHEWSRLKYTVMCLFKKIHVTTLSNNLSSKNLVSIMRMITHIQLYDLDLLFIGIKMAFSLNISIFSFMWHVTRYFKSNLSFVSNSQIINSDNVQEAARETDGYFIKSGIVTVIKDALIPSGTVI